MGWTNSSNQSSRSAAGTWARLAAGPLATGATAASHTNMPSRPRLSGRGGTTRARGSRWM